MRHCKIILIIGLSICSFTKVFAQSLPLNNPYKEPVFTQSSPEAAAFKRYGDVPVSLYTGLPDISIPLHTVSFKDMNVPLNLSYNAGGITVDQQATIVGLGWSLNIGGNITLAPVGSPETPLVGTMWSNWKKTIDFIAGNTSGIVNSGREAVGRGWTCGFEPPEFPDDLVVYGTAATTGMGDLDLYRVSLPNRSFTFFIHPGTQKAIFVGEKNKCKIDTYMTYGFLITDEYGVKYFFNIVEFDNQNNLPNAWYLSKMADVYGNEINFKYRAGSVGSLPQMSESVKGYYPSYIPTRNISTGSTITNYHVTAITTPTQRVSFEYTGRKDMEGGRLKCISVIDSVDHTVKAKYKFNYGYFTASTIGGDYTRDNASDSPQPTDYKSLRLKLESLSQVNPLDTLDTISHVFAYDERHKLPQKTSFAKDFWGYYNGRDNASTMDNFKHTSLPHPVLMEHIEPDFGTVQWDGWYANFDELKFANRFPDPNFMTSGTLKSITYPTGGRTELELEPHSFANQKMFEANDQPIFFPNLTDKHVWDHNEPGGNSTSHKTEVFTLAETTEVNLIGSAEVLMNDGFIKILNQSTGVSYMRDFTTQKQWDVMFTLPAGPYMLICEADDDVPYDNSTPIVRAEVRYKVYDHTTINAILAKTEGIGGGLRVKTVRTFDADNRLVGTKEYLYQGEDGKSSGRLLKKLDNFQNLTITTGSYSSQGSQTTRLNTFTFHANNFLDTRNSPSSVGVGYDRVLVRSVDGTSDLGEEISYFVNEPAMDISTHFSIYQNSTNGQLKKKVLLNHDRDSVQQQVSYYNQVDYTKNMLNLKVVDTYYGPAADGTCAMVTVLGSYARYNVVVYAYTNFVNQLVKTEAFDFSGSARLFTKTENLYDASNYQLDQTSTVTSDHKQRITQFTYPHDYLGDVVYAAMVENNMINPVVEQKEYLDGKLLKIQENKFWFWTDNQVMKIAPDRVKIGFGEAAPEDKILFDKYDSKGNLLQYHKPDETINTVFYRGHNDNRVVAKIVGEITYDQATSNAATYLSQLDDPLTRTQLAALNTSIRSAIPNALITTYTFDPLFGVTSETDPNGRSTFYEYDGLGRLIIVKDHDGNILKHFKYNYRK